MNDGDLSGRLNQLLSDPESMAKIAMLAQSFATPAPSGEDREEPEKKEEPAAPAPDPLSLLPPGLLQDLTQNSQERAELLRAVRPFLERERQEKLDRILSMLKTLDLLAMMRK